MSRPPPGSFIERFARGHQASLEAFNAGEFERAFAGLAPDVEWHVLPQALETGVLHGRDEVIRYFRGIREGVDWEVETREMIDAGEGRVLLHQEGLATGRTTRISPDEALDFFQLWHVGPDGLVASVREFDTREEAFAAAGLPAPGESG